MVYKTVEERIDMKYVWYMMRVLGKVVVKVYPYLVVTLPHVILAYALRRYANNAVFNYVLQNGLHLPRLMERKPKLDGDVYRLYPTKKLATEGYIKYRKISKVEYWLVLWGLWIWSDSDSNHDITDAHMARNNIAERYPKWVQDRMSTEANECVDELYGNRFELGDARTNVSFWKYPLIGVWWAMRNTSYNYNYMFEEIAEHDENNFYWRGKKWHFGYIPYSNSKRKGRLVYFTEDYDKVEVQDA